MLIRTLFAAAGVALFSAMGALAAPVAITVEDESFGDGWLIRTNQNVTTDSGNGGYGWGSAGVEVGDRRVTASASAIADCVGGSDDCRAMGWAFANATYYYDVITTVADDFYAASGAPLDVVVPIVARCSVFGNGVANAIVRYFRPGGASTVCSSTPSGGVVTRTFAIGEYARFGLSATARATVETFGTAVNKFRSDSDYAWADPDVWIDPEWEYFEFSNFISIEESLAPVTSDSISSGDLTAVPLPASSALLLTGLGLAGGWLKRRKKAA